MPAARAPTHEQKAGATPTSTPEKGITVSAPAPPPSEQAGFTRLHITPFNPSLLKVYLAPSVLPLARSISYHTVETFPEKGFGYVEMPELEAQKLKKKLNGATLKGSKVRIENAKPEKRKAGEDAADAGEEAGEERKVKRAKREKRKKEQGVLEGVELPEDRKVKRGWTEPPTKSKKEKKEKKESEKNEKKEQKKSKYTKEPELLFKAKLTPVAATELALKEKKDKKKDKKKSKSSREVIVHEFEHNTKQPTFLKESKVVVEKKPAVEYINGKGWVDEDGNVVEAETARARNRRVLELVDAAPVQATTEKNPSATPSPKSSPAPMSKTAKTKSKKATLQPSSAESEPESDESSVVSSSSEDPSSGSDLDSDAESSVKESTPTPTKAATPQIELTPCSPERKDVHPLEALFKRPKLSLSFPGSNPTSTPGKGSLAPINTSFSFFDNNNNSSDTKDLMDVDAETSENAPHTPFTQRDLEWRGLRSAAPTPDTAAIGRRFSFPWRNTSQEVDEGEDEDEEAGKQLSNNTKANAVASQLPSVAEENEATEAGAEQNGDANEEGEGEESEWRKWFYENRGDINRKWKKRRRDALKTKRYGENKKLTGGNMAR